MPKIRNRICTYKPYVTPPPKFEIEITRHRKTGDLTPVQFNYLH